MTKMRKKERGGEQNVFSFKTKKVGLGNQTLTNKIKLVIELLSFRGKLEIKERKMNSHD